ncbi:hypothetical protein BJV78DRAFT_1355211 [Lactifluus subvellereus]|nr:hypothetical protein BJV78DRAFT_1355211 [Lactifluus subvellereus]
MPALNAARRFGPHRRALSLREQNLWPGGETKSGTPRWPLSFDNAVTGLADFGSATLLPAAVGIALAKALNPTQRVPGRFCNKQKERQSDRPFKPDHCTYFIKFVKGRQTFRIWGQKKAPSASSVQSMYGSSRALLPLQGSRGKRLLYAFNTLSKIYARCQDSEFPFCDWSSGATIRSSEA